MPRGEERHFSSLYARWLTTIDSGGQRNAESEFMMALTQGVAWDAFAPGPLGHLHVGHVLLDGMRFRDGPRDRFRLRLHESRQRRTWDAVMVIEMAPVVDRMLALWNGQPVEPSTVYSRRCVENGGEDVFDPEDVLPRIGMLRGAAPDLHFDVADAFLAGRRNVVRLRASGTLNGSLITSIGTVLGTDRPFEMTGIEVFDIAEDLIVAVWTSWDWGRLYASLGVRA